MIRKRKIPFEVISNLGYYKYAPGKVGDMSGWFYWMDKELTDEQKAGVGKYENTRLFISQCEYAPEIRHSVIFVGNKCFGKKNKAKSDKTQQSKTISK